jgi:hypothetical protein
VCASGRCREKKLLAVYSANVLRQRCLDPFPFAATAAAAAAAAAAAQLVVATAATAAAAAATPGDKITEGRRRRAPSHFRRHMYEVRTGQGTRCAQQAAAGDVGVVSVCQADGRCVPLRVRAAARSRSGGGGG